MRARAVPWPIRLCGGLIALRFGTPCVSLRFTIFNTIDTSSPTSSVHSLPATTNSASFIVSWSGSDDGDGTPGSGIAAFDVFVSDDGGPFQLLHDDTTATSAAFTGEHGHSYRFYSVATDNVGYAEATPPTAQATTAVLLDTTAPTLVGVPANQTLEATAPGGAIINYTPPTATDDIDPDPTVSCSPPSGSTFPIGQTTVTCAATDVAGNSASANFTVTVIAPDNSGPMLERLDLARDARGKKVTQIILTFDEELNQAAAQTIAGNYELVMRKRNPKPVAIGSAVYAARTVTLTPSNPISLKNLSKLELAVRGAGTLTDLRGNPFDGDADGVPGGDLVRNLSQGTILSAIDALLDESELSRSLALESRLDLLVGKLFRRLA